MGNTVKDISDMNLFEKLAAITAEIGTVEKTLTVENGKKSYSAVAEKTVLDAVKPAEKKYRVFSYPTSRRQTTRIVEREYMTDGQVRKLNVVLAGIEVIYRFVNMDRPDEFIDTIAFGAGMDTGDKAPGKAMTYADKYALMKMYKISTGDNNDPDSQASPDSGFLFDFQSSQTNPMLYNSSSDFDESAARTLDHSVPDMKNSKQSATDEVENMTLEEARSVVLEIGSMKGKTFGEVMALKPSMVEFYAGEKFNSEKNSQHRKYKKAAQLLLATKG